MMTDPIADLITRIRNAVRNESRTVTAPHSKFKEQVVAALQREGYILGYETVTEADQKKNLKIKLKFGPDNEKVITEIHRVSSPGCRVYAGYQNMPRILSGLGVQIISTSKGIKSDRECRREKLGGEVLCKLW